MNGEITHMTQMPLIVTSSDAEFFDLVRQHLGDDVLLQCGPTFE